MQKRSISILTSALLIAGLFGFSASAAPTPKCDGVEGDYIVTLKDSANLGNEMKNSNGKQISVKYKYSSALNGFAAHLTSSEVCEFRGRPNVVDVEADGIVTADAISTQSGGTNIWGLDRIDTSKAVTTKTIDGTYNFTSNGTGVTAYVIDTGILATHPDFGGRVSFGFDAFGLTTAVDLYGHGTHVAGTIGGTTYGIAKNVNLVSVRVLDQNGSGSTSGVIAGINWVISNHTTGKAVANMSLGGGPSTAMDTAVKNLVADGVTTVVAAGNNGRDAKNYSPARVADAIVVGASDSSDRLANFSNYGTVVDVIAPGVNITSDFNDGSTTSMSGTSMATPHVAGSWAAILSGLASNPPALKTWSYSVLNSVILSSAAKSAKTTTALLFKNPTY